MSDEPHKGPIKVTVSCPETGKLLSEAVLEDNWTVICAGNRYVKSMQHMGRTVMVAIAVAKTHRVSIEKICEAVGGAKT